jgi:hypothetical protein
LAVFGAQDLNLSSAADVSGFPGCGAGEDERVSDPFDVPLEDPALLEEVELVSSLMIAAAESSRTLPPDEVDRLLGVVPRQRGAPTAEVAGPSSHPRDTGAPEG